MNKLKLVKLEVGSYSGNSASSIRPTLHKFRFVVKDAKLVYYLKSKELKPGEVNTITHCLLVVAQLLVYSTSLGSPGLLFQVPVSATNTLLFKMLMGKT